MKILNQIPKALLVSLILIGGIFYMLFTDPPYRFCDAQVSNFEGKNSIPKVTSSYDLCKEEARPGSCYDYFFYLGKLFKDLELVSPECISEIFVENNLKSVFEQALTLMTALAFDEKILSGGASRLSWLDRSSLNLFCRIKKEYENRYGRKTA